MGIKTMLQMRIVKVLKGDRFVGISYSLNWEAIIKLIAQGYRISDIEIK